jgi:hypothetical protein
MCDGIALLLGKEYPTTHIEIILYLQPAGWMKMAGEVDKN